MQTNHIQPNQITSVDMSGRDWTKRGDATPASLQQPPPLEALRYDVVERAAQALFHFVFSSCERLDGKHQWATCDEETKQGFRDEARAVILAAWPLLFHRPA